MSAPLLSLRQAAARTGLSVRALRDAVARHELAYVRLSPRGRLYVSPTEIDGWLARHRTPPGGSLVGLGDAPPKPLEALLPPVHERRFS